MAKNKEFEEGVETSVHSVANALLREILLHELAQAMSRF